MNVLVFNPFGIGFPHVEMALEAIQERLDAGDRVAWIGCTAEMLSCELNHTHLKSRCDKCVARSRHGQRLLAPAVPMRSFYEFVTEENKREARDLTTRFESTAELMQFRVETFDIGEATVSSYATMTKQPEVDFAGHRDWLDAFLRSTLLVYRAMQHYFDRNPTDQVYIFNGRTGTSRAALRAAESRGVPYVVRDAGRDPNHYAEYVNATAHDIAYCTRDMLRLWEEAAGDAEREKIARRFYEDRAAGGMAMSLPSYVTQQDPNRLPPGWDAGRTNVVVFTSSEDERTAAGPQWRNTVYGNQLVAVRELKESLGKLDGQVDVTVRVHPRLRATDTRHLREVLGLSGPRFTVLPPESPVHSYTLMREADTVVSYGSTMGIEAVYWGKPSVTAGPSRYQGLNATYAARSHDELVDLLNRKLEPTPREPALVYGFYCATLGKPYRYAKFRTIHHGTYRGTRVRWGPLTQYWWALVHRVPPLNRFLNRRFRQRTRELLEPCADAVTDRGGGGMTQ
jgi:hypothetical protein